MKTITANVYQKFLKPHLFKYDPEEVHDRFTKLGSKFGRSQLVKGITSSFYNYKDSSLEQNVQGQLFKNPVGLSAGFDYNGHMAAYLPSLGFGFNTVGTVTALEYDGNTKPRLLRLPKSKSLLVNKGFKSLGVDNVEGILDTSDFSQGVLGVSIGATNIAEIDTIQKAIDDYISTFNKLKDKDYIKYFEINISCPNTKMPESFSMVKNLELLLKEIDGLNIEKPLFIKLANEISEEDLGKQLEVCLKYNVKTAILSNLVKNRKNSGLKQDELDKLENFKGNFSGKPCESNSNNLISFAYRNFAPDLKIIGVGGIFSGVDAYKKIKLGSSLVELITGLVFEGPQLIGQINHDLVQLLKADGFENISEAIGTAHN